MTILDISDNVHFKAILSKGQNHDLFVESRTVLIFIDNTFTL